MLTAGMEDKAEIQALERAIYEISGNAIDIEEVDTMGIPG